jgi:arylsulfatase A-like enzyme
MAVSRRQFLQTGAVAGLGALQTRAVAGLGARSTRTQQKRPNILFIQTDDQRFDDLSCMGNRVLHTPNIDRLAEQGIRFRNAFVTTAICCCSRASVLTGQHMKRHRVRDFQTPLSEAQFANTYAALLRKAGYRTAYLGKYAIGFPEHSGQALSLPGHQFDWLTGHSASP